MLASGGGCWSAVAVVHSCRWNEVGWASAICRLDPWCLGRCHRGHGDHFGSTRVGSGAAGRWPVLWRGVARCHREARKRWNAGKDVGLHLRPGGGGGGVLRGHHLCGADREPVGRVLAALEHNIHYAKSWMARAAAFVSSAWQWLGLWLGSCLPDRSPDKDELAA